jgi:hypothetical protein
MVLEITEQPDQDQVGGQQVAVAARVELAHPVHPGVMVDWEKFPQLRALLLALLPEAVADFMPLRHRLVLMVADVQILLEILEGQAPVV